MSGHFLRTLAVSALTLFTGVSCKKSADAIVPETEAAKTISMSDLRQLQISGARGGDVMLVHASPDQSVGKWSSDRLASEAQQDPSLEGGASFSLMGRTVTDLKDADFICKSMPTDDIGMMCNNAYQGGAVAQTIIEVTKQGAGVLGVAAGTKFVQRPDDRAIYMGNNTRAPNEYKRAGMEIGVKFLSPADANEYLKEQPYSLVGSEGFGGVHPPLKSSDINKIKMPSL